MGTNASRTSAKRILAVLLAALMVITAIPMSAMAAPASNDQVGIYTSAHVTKIVLESVTESTHRHKTGGIVFDYMEGDPMVIFDGEFKFTVCCKNTDGSITELENINTVADFQKFGIRFTPDYRKWNDKLEVVDAGTTMDVVKHDETKLGIYTDSKAEVVIPDELENTLKINVEPNPVVYSAIEHNRVKPLGEYVIANDVNALLQKLTDKAVNFTTGKSGEPAAAKTLASETIVLDDEIIDFDIPSSILWTVEKAVENPDGSIGYYIYGTSEVFGMTRYYYLAMCVNENGTWNRDANAAPEYFDGTQGSVHLRQVTSKYTAQNAEDNANLVWFIDRAKDGRIYTVYKSSEPWIEKYTGEKTIQVTEEIMEGNRPVLEKITSKKVNDPVVSSDYSSEKFYLYFDKDNNCFKTIWNGEGEERTTLKVKDYETITVNVNNDNGSGTHEEEVTIVKETTYAKFLGNVWFDITNKSKSVWILSGDDDAKEAFNKIAATGAADFSFYTEQDAVATSIKVVEQPKLVYNEGEVADIEDMVVEIFFAAGNKNIYSKKIPERVFPAYKLGVRLTDKFEKSATNGVYTTDKPLTNSREDGSVFVIGRFDDGKTTDLGVSDKITVYKSPIAYYELADKLAEGQFVIVFGADGYKFYGNALSSDYSTVQYGKSVHAAIDGETFTYKYLNAAKDQDNYTKDEDLPIRTVNDRLDPNYTTIGQDEIWTLRSTGKPNTWYIISSNGEYLSRYADNEIDIVLKSVGGNNLPVCTVAKDKVDEKLASWIIDSSKDGIIYSEGFKTDERYYLCYGSNSNLTKGFTSNDTLRGTNHSNTFFLVSEENNYTEAQNSAYEKAARFDFYKVVMSGVSKIEVVSQPKLDYAAGDALDLSALSVKVTYDNGAVPTIAYANFAANNVTTDYANGRILTASADNGKGIVVFCGGKTAATNALKVSASNVTAKVERIAGDTRVDTAIAVAEKAFSSASTVVVANGWTNVDALSAAALASKLNAPILLVSANDGAKAAAEAKKLGAAKAYIIGGTASVSNSVMALFEGAERISGKDRVATALAVAEKLSDFDTIFVVGSNNYVDALSVGSIAAAKGAPILYTASKALDANVKAFLAKNDSAKVVILGGASAISNAVEAEIKGICANVSRIEGKTRFETSANINAAYADLFTSKNVAIASGDNDRLCDALAGSVYAAQQKMPIVLVDNAYSNDYAYSYINSKEVDTLIVFGGVAAVADETVDAVLGR